MEKILPIAGLLFIICSTVACSTTSKPVVSNGQTKMNTAKTYAIPCEPVKLYLKKGTQWQEIKTEPLPNHDSSPALTDPQCKTQNKRETVIYFKR